VLTLVAALSRADWRVLDLGPLYALVVALVLGVAHGLFWFGSAAGRALHARLPARPAATLPFLLAGVTFACLMMGARLREGAPAFTAAADSSWGMRLLLGAARRATDSDGDGFSARFGGGDCDDRRGDVYPGAEKMSPGNGVDENCEGGDAKASAATPAGAASAAALAPSHPRRTASRATCSSSRSMRCGPIAWRRRLRPPGRALADTTLDALARRVRISGAPGRRRPTRRSRFP
jgi:hypothetical protein